MSEALSLSTKQHIMELGKAVEIRLAQPYPEQGIWAVVWARLTLSWTNRRILATWRWSREQLGAALRSDDAPETAALLNLQALNCAIVATRQKDELLRRYAEELLVLSQQARSVLVRQ